MEKQQLTTMGKKTLTKNQKIGIIVGSVVGAVIILALGLGLGLGLKSSSNGSSKNPNAGQDNQLIIATDVVGSYLGHSPFICTGPFFDIFTQGYPYLLTNSSLAAWFVFNNRPETGTTTQNIVFGTLYNPAALRLEYSSNGTTTGNAMINFIGIGQNPTPTTTNPEIISSGTATVNLTGITGVMTVSFPKVLPGNVADYLIFCQNADYTLQPLVPVVSSTIVDNSSFKFSWRNSASAEFKVSWFVVPKKTSADFTSSCPLAFTTSVSNPIGYVSVTSPVTMNLTGQHPVVFAQVEGEEITHGFIQSGNFKDASTFSFLFNSASVLTAFNIKVFVWNGQLNTSFAIASTAP
jgi:hypothetical protein